MHFIEGPTGNDSGPVWRLDGRRWLFGAHALPEGKGYTVNSKEFARILGVSQATVSRALNNSPLVTEETKNMVVQKAAEYGFELNSLARSLKTNRTGTIGILFSQHFRGMAGTPMLAHFYDCLQRELIKYDYDIMLVYDYAPDKGVSVFERIIRKRKVDGLITIRTTLGDREMSLIKENNFPCVSMLMTRQKQDALYSLHTDSEYGGRLAGRFLGAFPDFEMMYIGFDGEEIENNRRCRSFKRGLTERGRELSPTNQLSCPMTFEAGYAVAERLTRSLAKKKLALFVYNDLIALGMLNAFREAGIRVPDQVQILGVDDIPLASWIKPNLSTLHVDVEEIIPDGCKLLRDLIENRKIAKFKSSYKPRLLLRDTTLPFPD
jgi:Transcriptional regulators